MPEEYRDPCAGTFSNMGCGAVVLGVLLVLLFAVGWLYLLVHIIFGASP